MTETATKDLTSGDNSVTIYLPKSINPDKDAFYSLARFEHGSMIGSIKIKGKDEKVHTLYGTDLWAIPGDDRHKPVERGVGLASEFGSAGGGTNLPPFGWYKATGAVNGVLGHDEVEVGEPFLKIGVGQLIKNKDQYDDTHPDFKGQYKFAKDPIWKEVSSSDSSITLEHEETLRTHGYRLRKDISLEGDVLTVKSTLTNLGKEAFSTPWYCHHLYSGDGNKIGPGYELEMDFLAKTEEMLDTPSWAVDIKEVADVADMSGHILCPPGTNINPKIVIKVKRDINPEETILAAFKEGETVGTFTLKFSESSGISLKHEIPEIHDKNSAFKVHLFKMYMTDGTFSPELFIMIDDLKPNQSTEWTQKITFEVEEDGVN